VPAAAESDQLTESMLYLITPFAAYLLGSVSSAILISSLLGLPDPRTEGSRNPGATNVLRLGSKPGAVLTLAGDIAKGVLPVVAARWFLDEPVLLALAALGAFPIRRGRADRESLRAARSLLDDGALLLVFPEGGRQTGDRVADLFDGTAYLAARAGARVVPVGIAGSGASMPEGARWPRPKRVRVVVGPPIQPPDPRAPRSALRAWTATLTERLQDAQDAAVAMR